MMILLRRSLVLALFFLFAKTDFNVHASASAVGTCTQNDNGIDPPFVVGRTLIDGILKEVKGEEGKESSVAEGNSNSVEVTKLVDVIGCCSTNDSTCTNDDGSSDRNTAPSFRRTKIGSMPQFSKEQALRVLASAQKAWDGGSGVWTQMSLKDRTAAIEKFVEELKEKREEIVNVLMWEIGKNRKDAESEFDRTISFVRQTIDVIRSPSNSEFNSKWEIIGKTRAFVRRAAIGIIMVLGPFNYPLNETYATLIPALLMGNIIIMKIPTVGGLAHLLTMDAFAKSLPPGAINLISGSGRETMPPLMATGSIDGLAFIGGSAAADDLIRKHPEPHRLKVFLQLEAKNMAIFLPDLFQKPNANALDRAVDEAISGSLSYNGQRCTALKILFVPTAHAEEFTKKFVAKVEGLTVGLPWQRWDDLESGSPSYSKITPLPNAKRVDYMKRLIADATSKGAKILNRDGGTVIGGEDSTLMVPAVLYPVTPDMDVYAEEQFGPVVPIVAYDDVETVLRYGRDGKYGQQCSVFTSGGNEADATSIVDKFSSVFGKININSQCGRSPDSLPFSGRRSSAMGVMSVTEALREFSVPTVVAYKDEGDNEQVVNNIQKKSNFLHSIAL